MAEPTLAGTIDSHTHLQHIADKGLNVPELLERCFAAGMTAIIDVGVNLEDHGERTRLAEPFAAVLRAEGLYPSEAERDDFETAVRDLDIALDAERVVAVGEIGLDFHRNYATPDRQQELFRLQLEIARGRELPVIIHNRNADEEILAAIRAVDPTAGGVMHCFAGDIPFARSCLDAGFFLSFAGNVTFKNAEDLRRSMRFVPADRILLETDAPYLAPHPLRGRTNHPGLIGHTYERVAAERGVPVPALAEQVRLNFNALFGSKF